MTDGSHPFHVFALDAFGNRVRVGLTYPETCEFERLDALEPTDAHGRPLRWDAQSEAVRRSEDRWFELYLRHEAARQLLEAAEARLAAQASADEETVDCGRTSFGT